MMQHQQNLIRQQRMMFQAQQPQPHQQQQPQHPQHPQQQPQQHQGLPVSLPNGSQPLNAAHMVAMHNPGMRPNMQMQQQLQQMAHAQPQNLQQQQQFLAIQQAAQAQAQAQAQVQQAQAQAQAQQVQQQNAGPQPGQHTPQPRPAPQPQSVHEAQSVTPQPQPGQPQHQGSATPQPNPPQAPASQPPQQQQQPVVTQPQPTPNLAPQQLPQAQPSGQQPQQQQQPQVQQPQPQQQQQQQQQQQPQQGQQHPGQQQGQQPHQMTAQEAQLKVQQQQQNAALLMQQRMATRGQSILSLGTFAEQLSSFQSRGEAMDLLFWQNFVDRFYSPTGVLRQGVYNPQAGSKQFEIATPALARYYNTQFTSGIRQIQMLIEAPRERDSPNGGHIVESPKASFIYWFTNDAQLFTTGTLRAHFDFQNKIEMLDIVVMNHTEYLPRSQLQALELSEQKQSPKVPKNMGKRAQQKQPQQPAFTLPESMVTSNGVPTPVMSFLEVAETISQMQLLFQYSQQNPNLTPSESLRSLVSNIQSQNQNPVLMQNAMNPALQQGPNVRAPSIGGPNQFASPAMAHLALPGGVQGSPHLTGSAHPSPAQSNLAGPPGMGPQGQMPQNVGSASASPNVSNKRRRASTVKMEGEDGGAEVNGTVAPGPAKVKASPRVGGKRQKGTAA
ncbi:LIM-domain binding protein-domain-containing protein [Aspergillus granulosus]|uniref:LIM-domain binding protein-domain-containing protein n=1 Tax=Aspergillus granulosus TaxID=176169 RepID=A0ABR4HYD6_9EURO